MPAPRWRPTASISSMKMMHGQFCLACSNRSRTRLAPTPTNISTKSEPEIEKNGTPASPATARASSVLPVPGGPNSSTPLGMRAPSAWNFFGFSRNSLISCSSSTASSTPATSLNVILGESTDIRLARLLPKLMTLLPPPCIWFIRKIQKAKNSTKGRIVTRMLHHGEPEVTEPSTTTLCVVGLGRRDRLVHQRGAGDADRDRLAAVSLGDAVLEAVVPEVGLQVLDLAGRWRPG